MNWTAFALPMILIGSFNMIAFDVKPNLPAQIIHYGLPVVGLIILMTDQSLKIRKRRRSRR